MTKKKMKSVIRWADVAIKNRDANIILLQQSLDSTRAHLKEQRVIRLVFQEEIEVLEDTVFKLRKEKYEELISEN